MKKNLKYLLTVLFTVVLLSVLCVQGFAADKKYYITETGNVVYYNQVNGEITVTDLISHSTPFVIPETIEGYPVTAIQDGAFNTGRGRLVSEFVLPGSLKKVGDNAFKNCTNLKTVTFGDLENCTIGEGAFTGCERLETVIFGTTKNVQIKNRSFYQSGLIHITIPEGTAIGQEVFAYCERLEKVVINGEPLHQVVILSGEYGHKYEKDIYSERLFYRSPNVKEVTLSPSFTKLYDAMFSSCAKLETLNTGTVTELSFDCFYGCKSLKRFDLTHVKNIPNHAFAFCSSLNDIDLYGVETIEEGAFMGCKSIESIDLRTVTYIGEDAFRNCTSIPELHFYDNMTVCYLAFYGCEGIKRVIIDDNVATLADVTGDNTDCAEFLYGCENIEYFYIGKNFYPFVTREGQNMTTTTLLFGMAAGTLNNLATIEVSSENPWYFTDENVLYVNDGNACMLVFYPRCKTNTFYSTEKALKDVTVPFTIGESAFEQTAYLKELKITKPITYMHSDKIWYFDLDNSFTGSSIEKITFPEGGLTYIGVGMFSFSQIRDIDLSKVEKVDRGAFRYCDNLANVDLPVCTFLGEEAFEYCKNLESVTLSAINPKRSGWRWDDSFGESVFRYCKSLHTVNIPNSELVPNSAFYGCVSLKNVNMPKCYFIDSCGFGGCTALETIDLPVKTVYSYAFKDCTSLKNIDMSQITSLDTGVFMNCTSLERAELLRVKAIDDYAFSGCTSLKNVNAYFVSHIYKNAFENCTELTIVQFSNVNCKFENDVFKNCPKVSFYCDEESDAYNYAIQNNIPILAIGVKFQQEVFEYTGSEIEPGIIVSISGMALTQNKDYTLSFVYNKDVGNATVTVHFIGDFEGLPDTKRRFTINPRSIADATVEYVEDYIYSGDDVRPAVIVTIDGKTLTEGVDYIIEYSDSANTGTMFFTVIGMKNYSGKLECYYNIIRCDIENTTATVVPDMVYNGSELFPKPTLMWNGFTLVEGVDYEIRYFDNVNSGHGIMVIYGLGNFCGTKRVQFRIFGQSITTAEISEISDMLYTGEAITPDVAVTLDGKTLQKDADYTVRYENNTEKGTATVIISGIGNYSGVIKQSFNIVKNSVYGFTVFSETQMTATYDGTPLSPEMEVYFGTERLIEGVDYTVTLTNNINAGKATVTVTGVGRFEGERSYDFTILPCEITENDITVGGSTEFNGEAVEPQITVTKNGAKLQNGVDYAVEYRNNNAVGIAYVTVKGLGNYCDTVDMEYEIYAAESGDPDDGDEPSETPETPVGPEIPENPETPSKPSEGTDNTDTPDEESPTVPEKPQNPVEPSADKDNKTDVLAPEIPNTDSEKAETAVWFMFISLTVMCIIFRRKKEFNV